MTRIGRTLATACALAVVAVAPAHAVGPATMTKATPIDPQQYDLTIATPALAAPTHVRVFLPKGYDADTEKRWPVTYYLHGAQGDETRFGGWYRDLVKDFPSIVVAPAGNGLGFYSDWYNDGRGGPPMIETYEIEQLVPLIDEHFRTLGTRAGRALIGESMGGYGVMSFAARHPDLFVTSTSMSGFLDNAYLPATAIVSVASLAVGGPPNQIYGPRDEQEVRWRGHNPVDLVGNLRDVDLQVRTSEGTHDATIEPVNEGVVTDCVLESQVFQTTLSFHRALQDARVGHVWKDYGAGCHTVPNFRREFAEALPAIQRILATPRPDPQTFDYRSIEPRFNIWGWTVAADEERALEFLQLTDAGRGGLTLTGSGTTTVTTPPWFKGLTAVDAGAATVTPDRAGRVSFDVDLGPAHRLQQYTSGAQGETFTTRTVSLRPHARLVLSRIAVSRGAVRVCVRARGGTVGARVVLSDARGRRLAARRVTARASARCLRLRVTSRGGRLVVRATGSDRFGHPARARGTVPRGTRPHGIGLPSASMTWTVTE